jgi:predicted metalloprotease with PDZ domain
MKKRIAWTMLATMAVAIAAPAMAGSGYKCTETTQACLNAMAKKKDKAWAGLQYDTAENGTTSVKAITAGSPAAAAGFQVGDVLVALNGAKMSDKEALKKAKGEWKIGQAISYTVSRGGAEKQLALTLAQMPPEVYASMVGSHLLESHVTNAMAEAGSGTEATPAKK